MRNWIDKNIKWVLTIPVIIFILLMIGYPLFYTFRLSFNSWSLSALKGMRWVGLKNYITLFTSDKFWIGCKIRWFIPVSVCFSKPSSAYPLRCS